jgi:hypothetical protein
VAWGGIEKPPATRVTTRSHQFVLLAGYTLGYTKLAGGEPGIGASHRRQSAADRHYPDFALLRQHPLDNGSYLNAPPLTTSAFDRGCVKTL